MRDLFSTGLKCLIRSFLFHKERKLGRDKMAKPGAEPGSLDNLTVIGIFCCKYTHPHTQLSKHGKEQRHFCTQHFRGKLTSVAFVPGLCVLFIAHFVGT